MTGLEIEIEKRKIGKKSKVGEKFSTKFISGLIGCTLPTTTNKLKNNTFTVEEAFAIFKTLIAPNLQTIDMFEYLFTTQI